VASFLLRRILWMIPTLLGITLVVFLAVHAAPGDPSLAREGVVIEANSDAASAVARVRAENLLDEPLWLQYAHFLGPFDLSPDGHVWFGGKGVHPWHGLLALEFGREIQHSNVDVASEIGRRLAVTVPLSLAAIVLTYLVAIPLGVWCAARSGTRRERWVSMLLYLLHALPTFWLALVLILVFGATGLGWLPVIGLHGKDADTLSTTGRILDVIAHALLPVLALSLGGLAYLSRQMRGGVVAVLREDFMRTARAVGLSEREALLRHGLKNALLPAITLFGAVLPALVGGSIVVETVFGIEGVGRYAYEGLLQRDTNIILATTVVSAVATMLGILLADVGYAILDPRIRHG
jgi:peptide/nickel transport system permease protein